MSETRTIAISLPDNLHATGDEIAAALGVTVGQLGANGDFHSAHIVSHLINQLRTSAPPWSFASALADESEALRRRVVHYTQPKWPMNMQEAMALSKKMEPGQ